MFPDLQKWTPGLQKGPPDLKNEVPGLQKGVPGLRKAPKFQKMSSDCQKKPLLSFQNVSKFPKWGSVVAKSGFDLGNEVPGLQKDTSGSLEGVQGSQKGVPGLRKVTLSLTK